MNSVFSKIIFYSESLYYNKVLTDRVMIKTRKKIKTFVFDTIHEFYSNITNMICFK